MGLTALTQAERLELCFFQRVYLVHLELPGKTLYFSDRNYTYNYGSVQNYENYLFDLSALAMETGRLGAGLNQKITLTFRNDKILNVAALILLNDTNRFCFAPVKIYELRLVSATETFASDVKTLVFRGMCGQPYDITRREFKLDCQNVMLAKRDLLPLWVIDSASFASADPDIIGKTQNTIYGSVNHVPCHCLESGGVDNLVSAITLSQTTVLLSDATEFPSSGTIGIDEERITYTGKSTNTLTGCTRGALSTTAVAHDAGSVVWQCPTRFVYQIARHPVRTIGDIYVDGVRVTSVATKYTGQTGSELSGYAGRAVFTVPNRITRQQAINLLISDGLTITDAIAVVDTIGVSDGISVVDGIVVNDGITVSDTIGVSTGSHAHGFTGGSITKRFGTGAIDGADWSDIGNAYDGNEDTYASCSLDDNDYINISFDETALGTVIQRRVYIRYSSAAYTSDAAAIVRIGTASYQAFYGTGSSSVVRDIVKTFTGDSWDLNVIIMGNIAGSPTFHLHEVYVEVEYTPSVNANAATGVAKTGSASKGGSVTKGGTASKSGTVSKSGAASKSGTVSRSGAITLSGNSVADVEIGAVVTAHVEGYQDDASGTYTGTASALIERPDHVIKHILIALLGEAAADIGASFAASGAAYGGTYKFGFILHEIATKADDLLQQLAFQARSKFLEWRGKFELIYMGSAPSPAVTFTNDELLEEPVFGMTPEIDIRNKIYGLYKRDYRKGAGADAYAEGNKYDNSASQAASGVRMETVELSACRTQAMADNWAAWYLAQKKQEWKTVSLTVPWTGKALDAGETFSLTWEFWSGLTWDLVAAEVDHMAERVKLTGQQWPV